MTKIVEANTVQERLVTFKNASTNGKAVKWPHRRLSMIGMARAFFYYAPRAGSEDRVVCVCCGDDFCDWVAFQGRPIYRHTESSDSCTIARLVRMSVALNKGESITWHLVFAAFRATYDCASGALRDSLVERLATRGFVHLPASPTNKRTVGCIECNCFPQNAAQTPRHCSKCLVPSLLLSLRAATKGANPPGDIVASLPNDTNDSGLVKPPKRGPSFNARKSIPDRLDDSEEVDESMPITAEAEAIRTENDEHRGVRVPRRPVAKGADSKASSLENFLGTSKQYSAIEATCEEELYHDDPENPNCKETERTRDSVKDPAELAVKQCIQLFQNLKLEGETRRMRIETEALTKAFSAEALMSHMEVLAMALLEEAHAKRIQLIQKETERVVTHLLESG